MSKEFFLFKFVRGWHLEYLWKHPATEGKHLSVKEGAAKTANLLSKVNVIINGPAADIILAILPDSENIITYAKVELPVVITFLASINTLPDIAESLEDYKFSDNPDTDELMHKIITAATLIFDDDHVSISDVIVIIGILQK